MARTREIWVATLLVVCLAKSAGAVSAASALPATSALPAGRTAPTLTLRWELTDAVGLVASDFGSFRTVPGGVEIGRSTTRLSTDAGPTPTTVRFLERVRVPAGVERSARAAGARAIEYVRAFADGTGTALASARFSLTGALAGAFEITRFELRFDDESSLRTVQLKESLSVYADINYSGTGALQAVWEVADPDTTSGRPIFRTLRRELRQLGGAQRFRLDGPALPTMGPGFYMVRLRVEAPDTSFELPVIRYFVASTSRPGDPAALVPVRLRAPLDAAFFEATTRFIWEPVTRARVYQLEIYEKMGPTEPSTPDRVVQAPGEKSILMAEPALPGQFVTGAMLPPGAYDVVLPAPSRARLQPGRTYVWRMRALAADGSVLGESPLRALHVPPPQIP